MYVLPKLTPEEILDYLRKSQADDPSLTVEETLEKHEQMLDGWVERNLPGMGKIPEGNRYREVVSGETIDSRPRFLELLRRIESPQIKAVLCVEPQRLSRGSLQDIGRLVDILRYSNTIVITMQYTYDLRDNRDRELFERELMRGNEYLEYYKRIQQNGRIASVQNGNFIGQTPPYGYKKLEIREGKRKCHTLEPDPDTAPVVKLLFELYRDGYGCTRIADKLDSLCIPAPNGGKWVPDTIPRFLSNEHYIGKVVWNKRATARTIKDGRVVTSRPVAEEYLVFDGKHEAIIDMELWNAVQAKKGSIPPNQKTKNFENPLAGLLFCKKCNRIMTRRTYRNKDGSERVVPRVACTNQRHCGTASATLSEVLEEVVKVLQSAIEDFAIRIEQGSDDSVEIHRQMVARMEKRLQELRDLEVKQWDEKIKGQIPPHIFDRLNSETLKEIEEVQQALCTAQDSMPEPVNLKDKMASFQSALDVLLNPDAPAREKNALLKLCIDRIEYDRERYDRRAHGKNGRFSKDGVGPIELDFELRV